MEGESSQGHFEFFQTSARTLNKIFEISRPAQLIFCKTCLNRSIGYDNTIIYSLAVVAQSPVVVLDIHDRHGNPSDAQAN